MGSSRLEKLRANWTKQNDNSDNDRRPNNYFPFYRMEIEETATVRLLPDLNEDNPLDFVVEKLMHNLEINGERKTVPCLTMYGEECPICKVSAAFYKEEGKGSPNGKKYWRKKQHLAQCLVVEDPLPADKETGETNAGKVKFLNIGWQLHGVIDEAFKSDELDEVPYDFDEGCNFIIKKSKQGEYSSYSLGSRFARKTTALTPEERAIVDEGMIDLSTLIPAQPDLEKVEAMLQAALNNSSYDESTGQSSGGSPAPKKAAPAPEKTPVKEEAPAPAAEADSDDGEEEAADAVMARIQARRKKKAAADE